MMAAAASSLSCGVISSLFVWSCNVGDGDSASTESGAGGTVGAVGDGGSLGSRNTNASIESAKLSTAPPFMPSNLALAVGSGAPLLALDRLSSFNFSSMASRSFLALSCLNFFRSSLLCLVNSSLVSLATKPFRFFSRSSQLGSLLLRLPLPKKPPSHSARAVDSSVTCTELVSADQWALSNGSGWENGCDQR